MKKPTKILVFEKVKQDVSIYANYSKDKLIDGYELQNHPLMMNSRHLKSLALSLRGYVKMYNSSQSVYIKELRRPKLTIIGLVKLIHSKI